jgi:hypothetical protein
MSRGRYSKPNRLQRDREARARDRAAEDGLHTVRLNCKCGAWLIEVDEHGTPIAIRPGAERYVGLDDWRDVGPPDGRGLVMIDFDMDDIVELDLRCPICERLLQM